MILKLLFHSKLLFSYFCYCHVNLIVNWCLLLELNLLFDFFLRSWRDTKWKNVKYLLACICSSFFWQLLLLESLDKYVFFVCWSPPVQNFLLLLFQKLFFKWVLSLLFFLRRLTPFLRKQLFHVEIFIQSIDTRTNWLSACGLLNTLWPFQISWSYLR